MELRRFSIALFLGMKYSRSSSAVSASTVKAAEPVRRWDCTRARLHARFQQQIATRRLIMAGGEFFARTTLAYNVRMYPEKHLGQLFVSSSVRFSYGIEAALRSRET
eukprot:scaffold19818_cov32-Prasinocladus_malaysianus.AAC.2